MSLVECALADFGPKRILDELKTFGTASPSKDAHNGVHTKVNLRSMFPNIGEAVVRVKKDNDSTVSACALAHHHRSTCLKTYFAPQVQELKGRVSRDEKLLHGFRNNAQKPTEAGLSEFVIVRPPTDSACAVTLTVTPPEGIAKYAGGEIIPCG